MYILFSVFRENKTCILGSPRIVKQQLLEFLSPISLHHGVNFLAAVSVAWQDRQETKFVPPNAPRKVNILMMKIFISTILISNSLSFFSLGNPNRKP